jgi:sugar O-acyltransferase (sialic acid O-acetyltransferase NeuD family)
MRVLVIGAGGHGQVVADILRGAEAAGEAIEFGGYLDDRVVQSGDEVVLGKVSALPDLPHDAAIVAIGDNETRARLSLRLETAGGRLAVARHPSAIVSDGACVGPGTMICAGAIVGVGARAGRGVILNTGCTVDHHVRVGDYAHIGPGARIGGDVVIGDGAFIGIGAIVLPQVTIGVGAVVGAGAVVIRNVPPGATVVGVPAKVLHAVPHGVTP